MFGAASRGIPSFGDKSWLAPVDYATTTTLPAYTVTGDTLTANANGFIPAIDGIAVTVGDNLLLKNGTSDTDNGIYVVTSIGSASTKWAMTRRSDTTPTAVKLVLGSTTYVMFGSQNANRTFTLINIVFGFYWAEQFGLAPGTSMPTFLTSFTITGGGTATYTSKTAYMYRIGAFVIANVAWTVNAAGSGATALSITNLTGMPAPVQGFLWVGDTGGTGAPGRIIARGGGTPAGISLINASGSAGTWTAPMTGSNLAAGTSWTLWGYYLTNDPN